MSIQFSILWVGNFQVIFLLHTFKTISAKNNLRIPTALDEKGQLQSGNLRTGTIDR